MKRNVVAWAALIVSSAALVSSSGLIRPMPAAPSIPAESQKTAHALSDAYAAVAEFVKPSVVQISVQRKAGANLRPFGGPNRRLPVPPGGQLDPKDLEEMLKKFFGPDSQPEKEQFGGSPRAEGTGSGFVYDDKGHILTNNHVVEGAGKLTVTFADGTEAAATVVGTDPQADVAVIKVDNTQFRPLSKGSSGKLRVGDLVMAVGSPFGLSQSVTTGIISATERNELGINGRNSYESFLQTDAAINPGNSGGPLVNMDGQVVGINSAIFTGGHGNDGVGFAIPIDMAAQLADKLIKDGKVSRARIGIVLEPLTPALAKQFGVDSKTKGVVVAQVLKDSPADKAGLKSGDVITSFSGHPVSSLPNFRLTVAASDAGKSIDLTYLRQGKEHTTAVVPAPADKVVFEQEKPSEPEKHETYTPTDKAEIKGFGLEVQPLTADLAKTFGLKGTEGLLVSAVKEGSPAEAAGIEPGQVITQVVKNKQPEPLKTVKEFEALAEKSDELAVYVQGGNQPGHFVVLSKSKKN